MRRRRRQRNTRDSLAHPARTQIELVLLAAKTALMIDGALLLLFLSFGPALHLTPPHQIGGVDCAREDVVRVGRHLIVGGYVQSGCEEVEEDNVLRDRRRAAAAASGGQNALES